MGKMYTEGEVAHRRSPVTAKSELPRRSEENAEVPPGGSKEHSPNCGLARSSNASKARNRGGAQAPAKAGF